MITIKNLKKSYSGSEVFKGLNLTVNDGDIVGVIGSSGAGKSLLLRYIILLDKPDSGELFLNDERLDFDADNADKMREKIGMVFQYFNLFGNYSVIENVVSGLLHVKHMPPQKAMDKASDILKQFGMWDKAFEYPSSLSGGQKQRAAIARTLAMDPEILLFDEPTSALDPSMKGEVEAIIRMLAEEGRTMVIASHEIDFLREVCNRIVFINQGVVCEEGSPEEILEHPRLDETRRFVRALKVLDINIESKSFDFIGLRTMVEQFAYRNGIPEGLVYKMHSVIEELSEMIIIRPKEDYRLKASFEYNSKNKSIHSLVQFTGPKFDPDDPHYFLSWPIIVARTSEIKFREPSNEEFTNELLISIKQ